MPRNLIQKVLQHLLVCFCERTTTRNRRCLVIDHRVTQGLPDVLLRLLFLGGNRRGIVRIIGSRVLDGIARLIQLAEKFAVLRREMRHLLFGTYKGVIRTDVSSDARDVEGADIGARIGLHTLFAPSEAIHHRVKVNFFFILQKITPQFLCFRGSFGLLFKSGGVHVGGNVSADAGGDGGCHVQFFLSDVHHLTPITQSIIPHIRCVNVQQHL